MRSQGTRIQVHIGQHDVAQLLKKRPPPPVIGQDAGMQHLGCGQHETRHRLLDGAAFCARGIAIVDRHAQAVLRREQQHSRPQKYYSGPGHPVCTARRTARVHAAPQPGTDTSPGDAPPRALPQPGPSGRRAVPDAAGPASATDGLPGVRSPGSAPASRARREISWHLALRPLLRQQGTLTPDLAPQWGIGSEPGQQGFHRLAHTRI